MKRSLAFIGILTMALVASGCAITDFEGYPDHQTSAESKLWGQEIAFLVGDPAYDGTYAYTVKYNNNGGHDVNMKIFTYRNPVDSSFSRDGQIDRDGDDVQGRKGILGGKFLPQWTATDPLPDCQFDLNRIQSHGNAPAPPILLCDTVEEEIDRDLELQASFASTADLLAQVWTGSLNNGFTLQLTGLTLGGTNVPLSQPFSIGARANGIRPTRFTFDLSQPGGAALVQAILNNTQNRVPISVGLQFSGGMSVNLPSHIKVAFNHDTLANVL